MAVSEEELILEIQQQLDSDVLSYGWLRQIVRDFDPRIDKHTITKLVYEAVVRIYDSGIAIIGNAKQIDGMVIVVPWNGTRDELLEKLDNFITQAGDTPSQDDLNGFWLERLDML